MLFEEKYMLYHTGYELINVMSMVIMDFDMIA